MFDEFNRNISYKIEGVNLVLDVMDNLIEAALTQEQIEINIENCTNGANKAWEAYERYKDELGIETTPIKSTIIKEETEEDNTQEKKEETKQVKEEYKTDNKVYTTGNDGCYHCKKCDNILSKQEVNNNVCYWCDSTSDNPIYGQCYDCGEYYPIKNMTFNGRSYHCGCVTEEPVEKTIVCPNCGVSMSHDEAIEYQDGIEYCYDCYNSLMNEIMGGDANGDLEEWEY